MDKEEKLNRLLDLQQNREAFLEAFTIHNVKVYTTTSETVKAALEMWVEVHEVVNSLNQEEYNEVQSEDTSTN